MRLGPGEYFGDPVWERRRGGLLITLSDYRPGRTQPWHRHANPTFFLLLSGDHRDHSRDGVLEQPHFSLVFHPSTYIHAGEPGPRGVRGLNIELPPAWLEQHGLSEREMGGCRFLDSARSRLSAIRFLAMACHPDDLFETELETQVLEFLEPLPIGPHGATAPMPRWLRTAEDFLRARFRESVGLRHVAREAGVHPVYLARVFRRRHGCSVGEYLKVLRLAEAGRLVLQGASLAQAAHAVGFADQSHFSRCFSAAFGFPPKGLRPAHALLQNQRLVSIVQDRG
jgi:AraC family transcriptional regulator